jgi:hypothetical protein
MNLRPPRLSGGQAKLEKEKEEEFFIIILAIHLTNLER